MGRKAGRKEGYQQTNATKERNIYKGVKQHRWNESKQSVINYKIRIFLMNQIPL